MIQRYTRKKMEHLWSEENRYENFLKVELAVMKAYVDLGKIPEQDYLQAKSKAHVDVKRIHEMEEITKHDVIAFTRSISEQLGEEKKWIHYSLTSTDVVDSAQSLILREVNEELTQGIEELKDTLHDFAVRYQNTPMIGRTHGIHAEITSFGLKFALFYDELVRDQKRFFEERKEVEVIKLSGAVGNFANIPPTVEEKVAQAFSLPTTNVSTQVLSRDRHAGYLMSLALLASCLEKIATELRLLSQTEIQEVEEGFSKGQKGSSAMPHKKNPISCENVAGLSRVIRSYVIPALEDNILWHERDISHSSVERVILADATTLLDYLLHRMNNILKHLVVHEEKMKENISLTYDVVYSGTVVSYLIDQGKSREEAYDLIQPLTFQAMREKRSFKEILWEVPWLSQKDQEELTYRFSDAYYLRNIQTIYQKMGW